ncbi:MAG: TM1802 family CRISPR-associated protein [Elusimicrobiota bacterium]|nr:TM1802 family CRISPR-associated protein [Endomicrobiia bacterium]MDW8166377.1 TM1802 family CRISPR-associated protein [Elusimicrobiota bacterium]
MLKSLQKIGEILYNQEKKEKLFTRNERVLCFDIIRNQLSIENFQSPSKYLYYGEGQGQECSTMAKIFIPFHKGKGKKEKTLNLQQLHQNLKKGITKIYFWFSNFCNKKNSCFADMQKDEFVEYICSEVKQMILDYNLEKMVLFTVKIDGKYLGEISEFVQFYKTYKNRKFKNNFGKCMICFGNKEVYCQLPYKFFTIDKKGYITGRTNIEQAYLNMPICADCYEHMEIAKSFLQKHKVKFFGMDCVIIPKSISIDHEKVYQRYVDILETFTPKDIESAHANYIELLSDQNEVVYDFLFIEQNNSQEKIKLYIEDVYPTRLKKIIDAAGEAIKTLSYLDLDFKNHISKFVEANIYSLNVLDSKQNISAVNHFRVGKTVSYLFYDILKSIFSASKVNERELLKILMSNLSKVYVNYGSGKFFMLFFYRTLFLLWFLKKLDIINLEVI